MKQMIVQTKPKTIKAIQVVADDLSAPDTFPEWFTSVSQRVDAYPDTVVWGLRSDRPVRTPADQHLTPLLFLSAGDWVVKYPAGLILACTPSAFERDYTPLRDGDPAKHGHSVSTSSIP